jgi:hypothetical protein
MAYNPFDDVILNDPAYMANGGQLPRPKIGIEFPQATQQEEPRAQLSVRPTDRIDYSQQKDQFRPFASAIARGYQLLTPEQETLDQIERDQQLRSLATAQAFTGTDFEEYAGEFDLPSTILQDQKAMDLLNNVGFKREGFTEGLSRVGQFFYGNQRKAFDKLKSGEQLNSDDRLSIALAPLDSLDFLFPPLIIKKLAGLGLKNVNAVLKSTSDLPEVQQVKQFFGGSPLPSSGIADGPPGMTRQQVNLAPPDEIGGGKSQAPNTLNLKELNLEQRINEVKKNIPADSKLVSTEIMDKIRQTFPDATKDQVNDIYYGRKKVKGKSVTTRPFDQNLAARGGSGPIFARKDPRYNQENPGGPAYQYLKNMSDDYLEEFNEVPRISDLRRYINEKGSDEAKEFFVNNQRKIDDTIRNEIEGGRTADAGDIVVKGIQNTGATIEMLKNTRPDFQGDFDKFLSSLDNDSKLNTIINNWKTYLSQYTNKNGKPLLTYQNITKYIRENNLVPPRSRAYDPDNYTYNLKGSGKKGKRVSIRVQRALTSEQQLGEGALPKGDPIANYMHHKSRSMTEHGEGMSFETFIKDYVKPYVGKTSKETQENLKKAYPDIDDFLKLEKKYQSYEKELGFMMELLENTGRYTPQQLDRIAKSLKGNRSHTIPISKNLKKNRFLELSGDARFIRIQPAVYNQLYQPVYDQVLDKVFTQLLGKNVSIDKLKSMKPQQIKYGGNISKRRLALSGIDIDVNDYIKSGKSQYDYLNDLYRLVDDRMKKLGMQSVIGFDPKNTQVLKGLKITPDDEVGEVLVVGSKKALDPKEYLRRALEIIVEEGVPDVISPKFKMLPLKQGGPVRMAIGGDPLENINQQQFTPDPAFEGKDFFQEAVDSGSLTAFNPLKLFKVFGKVDAVETPKKKIQTDTQQGPPGTTLPATQEMQPSDFALKSFTLETIMDPNAPKAARPQDWQNFFKGKAAPEAELRDSGILQYLGDFNKYFPNQKITQQQLVDFYETSPMGNISIKVKQDGTNVPADPAFLNFSGRPRHQGTGQQPLDEVGRDYREVVVQAGPLPGEGKPFVASGHFQEENVIGFTRVATYDNASGQPVAVIQELQTDMLTKVRKEQERLNALLKRIENVKAKAQERIAGTDEYYRAMGQRKLDEINQAFPPATLQKLQENLSAIKPFPNTAGAELIPGYAKELSDLQKEINKLAEIDIANPNPQTIFGIDAIETKQQKVLDNILDLTRDTELERDLKGIQVPSTRESDELVAFGESADDMNLQYGGFKDLELFPPIPFNKQPDYVDLLIKATIKDAQTKGINKVAIMPAEKVNRRWGKNPDGPEGKKFKNLYDQVAVQQLKNIAKKYKGNVAIEQIVDKTKANKGLKFFNKNVDGELELLKDFEPRAGNSSDEVQDFLDTEIESVASDFGSNEVVIRREIAPGQTMEYYVQLEGDDGFKLVPLGDADRAENATIIIDEYNPQLVDMVTLTLDSPQSKEPFFMFKKKDGGTIAKDSLVSVTDIFGQYGR